MSKAKLLACLVGAGVSCLLGVAAGSADETYTVTLSGPTGGVTLIRDTGTGTLIGPS